MITINGMSIVLLFLKLLSGNRNFWKYMIIMYLTKIENSHNNGTKK
jgi:hypothetical protein